MNPPTFLADHMNGDLAKWLRILGFDCKYPESSLSDKEILEICMREGRILLTKDRELHSYALRRGVRSIYISGDTLIEKFRNIYYEINLNTFIHHLNPRCTQCNSELILVKSDSIKEMLYEDVASKYDEVYLCKNCGKIYWEGSHWRGINKTISKILKLGLINNDKNI